MWWRPSLLACALLSALALAACNPGVDPTDIFPEMHYQPNHKPLEPERLAPAPGAVPVGGGRVPLTYTQARPIQDPLQSTPAALAHAKDVYATNCATCHGDNGKGDGPIARYYIGSPTAPVPPADLTSAMVRQHTDGELYWIVANGLGNMPAFGDQLTDTDLWSAVLAIRNLESPA
ncbi:MAG TPA: cytochrome c [Chloroflexota bacterium]|jgi:mono/diheme cytochrome c family protein|nr:cytochrome c [Chloroflexota bacterium]